MSNLEGISKLRELMHEFGWNLKSVDALTEALWRAEKRSYVSLDDIYAWGEWQTDCFAWVFYAVVTRPPHQGENPIELLIPYFATKQVTVSLFIEKMSKMLAAFIEATAT